MKCTDRKWNAELLNRIYAMLDFGLYLLGVKTYECKFKFVWGLTLCNALYVSIFPVDYYSLEWVEL